MDLNDESAAHWQDPPKRSACSRCRQQKLRCFRTGPVSKPCLRCQRAKVPCVTSPSGRVGRPPRNSTRPEPHAKDGQSLSLIDVSSLDAMLGTVEQDPSGAWQNMAGRQDVSAVPGGWASTTSSRAPNIPSWVFQSTEGEVDQVAGHGAGNGGYVVPEDGRRDKEVASQQQYASFSIGPSAFPHPEIHSHATTSDEHGQASPLERLLALQNRILLHKTTVEVSPPARSAGHCQASLLDRVLQDCSELTAILAEMDNSTDATSPSDGSLSTWLGTTPTDSDHGIWYDYNLNESPGISSMPLHAYVATTTTTTTTTLSSLTTRSSGDQTRSEASGEQHAALPQPAATSIRKMGSGRVDIIVLLATTSCYIQLMRTLHCALRRLHDSLVVDDEAAITSLLSTAACSVALPEVGAKSMLRVKIAIEVVLHVLDCLEARMPLSEAGQRMRSAGKQDCVEALCRDSFATIIRSALEEDGDNRVDCNTADLQKVASGGDKQKAQNIVRAEISKISSYISQKPLI